MRRLAGILTPLALAALASAADEDKPAGLHVPFEFPARSYVQRLEVTFATEVAAQRAALAVAPLFDGRAWAISSRWDDNAKSHEQTRRVLAAHGHKGTFYLNDPGRGAGFTETARKLLEGGNSIGGHSLTHPMLGYLHPNRMFEEVAGVRMRWEAALDVRVVSYSFSFCHFRNDLAGPGVQVDITRALERAGYYNIANGWYHRGPVSTDMILSPIMPWDGKDIDQFARDALADESFRRAHPNLSYAMHSWYSTPAQWAKFEKQLDDYGRKSDWWYCNQNEYAAYRYQFLRCKLSEPEVKGRTVRLALRRPVLADLNDPTPLTVEVAGVSPEEVAAVACPTAGCVRSARQGDRFRFHVFHDRGQRLPERIGLIANEDNHPDPADSDRDGDFPDVRALLSWRDGRCRLALVNKGRSPLTGVEVCYRLPPAWAEGIVRRPLPDVAPGKTITDAPAPTPRERGYRYQAGSTFFAAQVDFTDGNTAGRLHLSCRAAAPQRDPSYPQGGFARLGPIPEKLFDLPRWDRMIRAGEMPAELGLPDGKTLRWRADDRADDPPGLDPEAVRTSGNWLSRQTVFHVLRSELVSPRGQPVELRHARGFLQRIYLNGQPVPPGSGPVDLAKGVNQLVLVHRTSGSGYQAENAASLLRVARPGSNDRVEDVEFRPPARQDQRGG
ncbi:MAG TPA: polysaccharide deacetylase family protein [Phycisphaerae bacterium]|nr:polysaccharide deacetylase family protein [Phycisphaerae bacterium]